MALFPLIVMALIQGLTEFLPVGTEAHLLGLTALGVSPRVPLELGLGLGVGAWGALVLFCGPDLLKMGRGVWRRLRGKRDPGARLAGQIALATLPLALAATVAERYDLLQSLTTPGVVGGMTLIFGVLLWLADWMNMTVKRVEHLSPLDLLVIGLIQVSSLLPGAGRVGVVVLAGRFVGSERRAAFRLALLLSVPALTAGCLLGGVRLTAQGGTVWTEVFLIGAGIGLGTGLAGMAALMAWLRRHTFAPFAHYRVILGTALLVLAYAGPTTGP